jgi:uncharacterized protein (TIGR03435 family)
LRARLMLRLRLMLRARLMSRPLCMSGLGNRLFLLFSLASCLPGLARSQQAVAAPQPAFETASIRPSHLTNGCFSMLPPGGTHYDVTCLTLRSLIALAWKLHPDDIQGPAAQGLDTYYDLRATTPDGKPWTPDTVPPMLRQLLQDRFHLAAHSGTKLVPGFGMTVAKAGLKLKSVDFDPMQLGQKAGESSQNILVPGYIRARNADLGTVAALLSAHVNEPVVDRTGIAGVFNMDLRFSHDADSESSLPDFFTAVEEQLGLKLHAEKVTVKTLVIDHVDGQPTPN